MLDDDDDSSVEFYKINLCHEKEIPCYNFGAV